jgi:predicted phosphodiesterase
MSLKLKTLLVAPKFYDYHKQIIKSVEGKGVEVDFFPEDITTLTFRIMRNFSTLYVDYVRRKYLQKILDSVQFDSYKTVLVIRGDILTVESLEILRAKLPTANFVMYQWDSNRQSRYKDKIKYFDIVKTFDLYDSEKYGIEYQSLFYSQHYKAIASLKKDMKYDLVFYGAFHSDRLEVIRKIDIFCIENDLVFKHHLYISKLSLVKKFLTRFVSFSDLKFLKTYKSGNAQILDAYSKARCVLDVELNIQTGITMRTFEALGSGVKVVTTNSYIAKDPIYSAENICIIDRHCPTVDLDFIKSDFKKNSLYERSYIDNWLDNILDIYVQK